MKDLLHKKEKTCSRKPSNKNIEIKFNIKPTELVSYLAENVPFQEILHRLNIIYALDGVYATTGLPIITNEESCHALVNALICKYILDNWEKITKQALGETKKKGVKI